MQRQGGYLVDFVSTAADQTLSVSLSERWQRQLRRPADVLDLLVNLTKLSAEKARLATQRLGAQAARRGGILSPSQPFIALAPGIAELLARAELLKLLVTCARVAIDASESDQLHAQIRHIKSRDALVGWLQDARTGLQIGLARGRIREVASSRPIIDQVDATHPNLRCLRDFLDTTREADIISCCDDRWLSRLVVIGRSQVVGLSDVLQLLHERGVMGPEKFYALLHRMRAGNMRYLPPLQEDSGNGPWNSQRTVEHL
ncbi:MAG: hypothetical protein JO151_09940 [Verrucomicrobia bacterium]|nr:hypothetical protein [Verrucomicrobiota bacterium]